jgi:hypothetical protein
VIFYNHMLRASTMETWHCACSMFTGCDIRSVFIKVEI